MDGGSGSGQERECGAKDREKWKIYRERHIAAIQIMNVKYEPLEHKACPDCSDHQRMRYKAERDFFDLRNKSVRDLMRQVTEHQYRHPKAEVEPIDLTGESARVVIAAARLQQETWISLADSDIKSVYRNIPCAREGDYMGSPMYFGAEETYTAKFGERKRTVKSEHRTEAYSDPKPISVSRVPRLGISNVVGPGKYLVDTEDHTAIVNTLKETMNALERADPGKGQKRLAQLLIKFAHSHCLLRTKAELPTELRDELFKICFLIMEKEQAQWQASFFIGDEKWRLGMSVSFARLIILFRDGHITLDDVFKRYGIYCGFSTLMPESDQLVRERCDKIDLLYKEKYKKTNLTRKDAWEDLLRVYGGEDEEDEDEEDEEE